MCGSEGVRVCIMPLWCHQYHHDGNTFTGTHKGFGGIWRHPSHPRRKPGTGRIKGPGIISCKRYVFEYPRFPCRRFSSGDASLEVDTISNDEGQSLILMIALSEEEMDKLAAAHELRPHLDWSTLIEKDEEMWLMLACRSEGDLDIVESYLQSIRADAPFRQMRKIDEGTYKDILDEGFSRIIDGNALQSWEHSRWDEAALPWD